MKRKFLAGIVLLATISVSATGVTSGSGIEIDIQHITTRNGLPANSIRCVFQDSQGFIWIGTINNGLCKYDGRDFRLVYPEYGDEPGLADPRINGISEDRYGHLWISTMSDQISCYDLRTEKFEDYSGCGNFDGNYGHVDFCGEDIWLWGATQGCMHVSFKDGLFSSTAYSTASGNLPSDYVTCLLNDGTRTWIGTSAGLCCHEGGSVREMVADSHFIAAEKFADGVFFISDQGDLWKYSDDHISQVGKIRQIRTGEDLITGTFSPDGNSWLIFTTRGAYSYDITDNTVSDAPYPFNLRNAEVKNDGRGNFLVYDKSGNVVFADTNGVAKAMNLMFKDKSVYWTTRYGFTRTADDIVWISTHENGLFAYDITEDKISHFSMDGSQNGNSSNILMCIMEDKSSNLWIGSEYSGIFRVKVINYGASYMHFGESQDNEYADMVRMTSTCQNGEVWVCTRDGNVYVYDEGLENLKRTDRYTANVYAVCMDDASRLWIGTRGNGIEVDGRRYVHANDDPRSLSSDVVFSIVKDSSGDMWIGTFGGGVNLAEDDGNGGYRFRSFFNDAYSQRHTRAMCIDRAGYVWVGNSNGVIVFNPDSLKTDPGKFYSYNCQNGKLRSNECRAITCDSNGRVWIAETGAGFCICNPGNYSDLDFTHYGTENGLANGLVQGFIEDINGRMWITTEYGISCLDPETGVFRNFTFSSNMQSNVCLDNSTARLKDGRLLVGTNSGLAVINPDEVRIPDIQDKTKTVFTSLKINGYEVIPGEDGSPTDIAISYSPDISLKHGQNSFSISFSTLDYSPGVLYSYMLNGYDTEWSPASEITEATYRHIPHGRYEFLVKAYGALGEWQEIPTSANIRIMPPFYQTPLAYVFYVLFFLAAIYLTYRVILRMTILKNAAAMEKQLAEYKLVFFTNVSHEFRTPLTLILHSLEKLRRSGNLDMEDLTAVKTMESGTNRLLRLVNQLLEFRKIQNDKHKLQLEYTNVVQFCREIFETFRESAGAKRQELNFVCEEKEFYMYLDRDDMDKIIYNLLSNAVKYTPEGGKIELSLVISLQQKTASIIVKDNGKGVPKERQGDLFTRFNSGESSESSMGIGLHLTKSLVDADKGRISFSENPEGGTIMTVELPLDTSIYSEDDFKRNDGTVSVTAGQKTRNVILKDSEYPEKKPAKPLNHHKILVVDDEPEIRRLIADELREYFNVVEAGDGKTAIEILHSGQNIELVVCDVMMPGMSGYEVTEKIKEDFDICHIPVILLTALDSDVRKLQGIQSGADSYITKPFRPDYVLTRILKLLEQRSRLREKFSSDLSVKTEAICTNDIDREFMDKVDSIIDRQIGNPTFSMDDFACEMAMGRSSFYNKIRSVTGYSPNKYIMVLRMKKAAELIITGKYTAAEVGYQVGIQDASYFSKRFREQFGISPKAYYKKAMEDQDPDNSRDD